VPLAGICYCAAAAADGASQAAQTISSKKQECKDSLRDKNARAGAARAAAASCQLAGSWGMRMMAAAAT
jgi:hypothetical protein